MRVPRVRFTVRGMMGVLFCFAITLHLALTARRVHAEDSHLHLSVSATRDGPMSEENFAARAPFWSRYWRRLLGRDGRIPGLCTKDDARLEACELEHPEICRRNPPNTLT